MNVLILVVLILFVCVPAARLGMNIIIAACFGHSRGVGQTADSRESIILRVNPTQFVPQ